MTFRSIAGLIALQFVAIEIRLLRELARQDVDYSSAKGAKCESLGYTAGGFVLSGVRSTLISVSRIISNSGFDTASAALSRRTLI